MHLTKQELQNYAAWEEKGFILPQFDIEAVRGETKRNPEWIHFGAGNIFRAFPGALQQNLLNKGLEKTGIIVAEGYDYEIIEKMNKVHDELSLLVTLKSNGTIEKTVIGSIVESLTVDTDNKEDMARLKEIFRAESLKMVSFTITEKGYQLKSPSGEYYSTVQKDFCNSPEKATSYIGKLAALLYERYCNGKHKLALVSMDNCSHNGSKLYEAVYDFAKHWEENGVIEKGFITYISTKELVSFPWSMIDKITPRPDESVKQMLLQDGFEDVEPVITSKNTYVAPFVNAEEPQYLVIEDAFPNGRPRLEEAGVIFTTKEIVDRVEKMKVCTCLNPLHTALAVFGCLLGYTEIYKEMRDEDLRRLVERIGYIEGLKVVVDPGILSPKDFIDEVLNVRVPNPFMPDTPQRIATDTSQKLSIRFGETIKAYKAREELSVNDLIGIPLVLAGWCRYLMGVDDQGQEFTLSSDPMLELVVPQVKDNNLKSILSNATIFGVDLYEIGLGEKVESLFHEMMQGNGAVRKTLQTYI